MLLLAGSHNQPTVLPHNVSSRRQPVNGLLPGACELAALTSCASAAARSVHSLSKETP